MRIGLFSVSFLAGVGPMEHENKKKTDANVMKGRLNCEEVMLVDFVGRLIGSLILNAE
jgi:hypothetical protein